MDGVVRIDKVVMVLEVWLDATFPMAKMKVKVLDRAGDFLAIPNLCLINPASGDPEFISGLGGSVEEAVDDLLGSFVADARSRNLTRNLAEADFKWAASEDF